MRFSPRGGGAVGRGRWGMLWLKKHTETNFKICPCFCRRRMTRGGCNANNGPYFFVSCLVVDSAEMGALLFPGKSTRTDLCALHTLGDPIWTVLLVNRKGLSAIDRSVLVHKQLKMTVQLGCRPRQQLRKLSARANAHIYRNSGEKP